MGKIAGAISILLILTVASAAQDSIPKILIEKDNMENDVKRLLIRWAGSTLRLNLSERERLMYSTENAIIIGLDGHPNKLIATHDFRPSQLTLGLEVALVDLKNVVIGNFGQADSQKDEYLPVQEWLGSLYQLETLVLSNVNLSNIGVCKGLPLKYLDLRNIYYDDKEVVLSTIGNFQGLQIFVHDESFPSEDIVGLKQRLPSVAFAAKASGKKKQ